MTARYLLLPALLLAGLVVWLLLESSRPDSAGSDVAIVTDGRSPPTSARGESPRPEPTATGEAKEPAKKKGEKTGYLLLPNGKRVRALNGVADPVELLWPPDLPWSPIVGRQTDPDGLQWYVHADGSRSTTQMVYRSDLGRETAMSFVANPKKSLPLKSAADEAREALGGKKK